MRGYHFGYDWETAVLFSQAQVRDSQNSVSGTLFEQSMAKPSADAYNPFGATNSQATTDSVMYESVRKSQSSLYLWDLKFSRPDLFALPAGDLGVAAGSEMVRLTRREIQCLKWAADGKTDADIGQIMKISTPTVRFHMRNAADKMDVAGRPQAVHHATTLGYIGERKSRSRA